MPIYGSVYPYRSVICKNMNMKVILLKEVPKLGKTGDVKSVSDGYGRNFLLPQGLAELATDSKLASLDRRMAERVNHDERERKQYETLAAKLGEIVLSFTVKVGEKGQAFGSVTREDIIGALKTRGIAIERGWIELEHGIKAVGEQTLTVAFPHNVIGHVKIAIAAAKGRESRK